jgi:hypothetical protein
MLGIVHTTWRFDGFAAQLPAVVVAREKPAPFGSVSVTVTFWAASGPPLVTVMT